MGYQFLHLEVYARSVSKLSGVKRAKKGQVRESDGIRKSWSAREILAEALREVGACNHVDVPATPEVMLGDLHALATELEQPPPKGMRKDTPILLAGVLSAPWPPGDPRSAEWRQDNIRFLKNVFGDALNTVIAHSDEPYDHQHFYVRAKDWGSVKPLHPGLAARQKCKSEGGSGTQQMEAFNEVMKGLQDRYFNEVGQRHGLARIGPKRRRLGRAEWVEEKKAREMLAQQRKQADEREKELAEQEQKQRADQAQREADLHAREGEAFNRLNEATQKRKAVLSERRAELDARAAQLDARAREVEQLHAKAAAMTEKLEGLLSRFYKTMRDMAARLTWTDRDQLKPLLSDVDQVRDAVEELRDPQARKAKQSGLFPPR